MGIITNKLMSTSGLVLDPARHTIRVRHSFRLFSLFSIIYLFEKKSTSVTKGKGSEIMIYILLKKIMIYI